MVANALRGEVVLALGDATLLLRPSFAALVAAEAEVGSLFRLLDRAGAGDVKLAEMGALFWHCMAAPDCERAAFEARLLDLGVASLLRPYRALLAAIFGG
jgi:hypothetical protein